MPIECMTPGEAVGKTQNAGVCWESLPAIWRATEDMMQVDEEIAIAGGDMVPQAFPRCLHKCSWPDDVGS